MVNRLIKNQDADDIGECFNDALAANWFLAKELDLRLRCP